MEKLNKKNDLNKYLEFDELITPFLKRDFVENKVIQDYNYKKEHNIPVSKIKSLILWINHNVKPSIDEEFLKQNKFRRSAKEIWESKLSTGCTDYAILFACFARQLGYPTTILCTAELEWLRKAKDNQSPQRVVGHKFCECYVDNKWILVDPANNKIIEDYNNDKIIKVDYDIHNSKTFIPYQRVCIVKPERISEHNKSMEEICLNLNN